MKVNLSKIAQIPQTYRTAANTARTLSTSGVKSAATTPIFRGSGISAGNRIVDVFEAQIDALQGEIKVYAEKYLKTLEKITKGLKDQGFEFDIKYCEENSTKSTKSWVSKVMRSGKFKVQDPVRATVYCSNLYDLSMLNDFLIPAMKKENYVLATVETPIKKLIKKGYIPTEAEMKMLSEGKNIEKVVPDLDIRLHGVSDQIAKLDPEYKYAISHAQKSGYEDIQMRFLYTGNNKAPDIPYELIVISGKEMAKAKHIEYNEVYNYLRHFEQLNLTKIIKAKPENPVVQKAARYIDLIMQLFQGKISKKLYLNAKNKDIYGIMEEVDISFNPTDITLFKSYFEGLNNCMKKICAQSLKDAATKAEKAEIRSVFQSDRDEVLDMFKQLNNTVIKYSKEGTNA